MTGRAGAVQGRGSWLRNGQDVKTVLHSFTPSLLHSFTACFTPSLFTPSFRAHSQVFTWSLHFPSPVTSLTVHCSPRQCSQSQRLWLKARGLEAPSSDSLLTTHYSLLLLQHYPKKKDDYSTRSQTHISVSSLAELCVSRVGYEHREGKRSSC